MNEIKQYVFFNPGLIMKTDYLTEIMAYFLGGIFVSEEQVTTPEGSYKIAPVRYNYNAASELEIAQHYELVKKLASSVNGQTYMAESIKGTLLDSRKNRMPGFSTFFRSTTLEELKDLIPNLRTALKLSPWSVQRSFLVGIFDGRGSADIDRKTHKVRMLAVDCISEDIGMFLAEMVEMANISYNYNTHRKRREGGRPRNPQLRIRDVDKFISEIGLISPRRINLLKEAYEYNYKHVEIHDDSKTLLGLKTIHMR